MIAKLRGHKNNDAPCICYIAQSNCLVSAEKNVTGNNMTTDYNKVSKNDDPNQHPSHKISVGQKSGYQ
jgi:hypothetical protein